MNLETAASLEYRFILREELNERQARNPGYSLRAFARDTDLSVSHLSSVLRFKDRLSVAGAQKVALKLGYERPQAQIFIDLVKAANLEPGESRDRIIASVENQIKAQTDCYQIHHDQFHFIAGWHHLAILCAAELKRLERSVGRIAEALKIKPVTAKEATKRLARLGLAKLEGDTITPLESKTNTSASVPSPAIQSFHKAALSQVSDRLHSVPIFSRYITNTLMAVPESSYPTMEAELAQFLQDFVNRHGCKKANADQVYQLTVGLVPMIDSALKKEERLTNNDQDRATET